MRRHRWRWIYAAFNLAGLVLLCSPTSAAGVACEPVVATAQAADPTSDGGQAGSGGGGTDSYAQHLSATGSGSGGTGFDETGGSGTGGTGIFGPDGSGSGGTGIYGTVVAFGSVCVNGLKIEYDGETPVETNGRKARAEDLELGQIVRIETRRDDPNRAHRITIESPLSGPIGRVEPERGRLYIMGAEVRLRPGAVIRGSESQGRVLADLQRGDHVAVSGLRRSDGVLMASRLDLLPAGTPALVTGVALPIGDDTFYVGRVRSQLAAGGTADPALRRARVQIRGTWNLRTQTLEDVAVRAAPIHLPGVSAVSVQGYVARDRGPGDFKIAGTRLSVSNRSDKDHSFHLDALVRVRGQIDQAGRLQASHIVIEERGRPEVVVGGAPIAAAPGAKEHDPSHSAVESLGEQIEDQLDRLGPEAREEIKERVAAAGAEVAERLEPIERAKIEERVERIDRDEVQDRVERVERFEREQRQERIERVERIERDERVERIEKEVRNEIQDRIDRFR
jgi:hypothetical protein